jgi:hypothetical protein
MIDWVAQQNESIEADTRRAGERDETATRQDRELGRSVGLLRWPELAEPMPACRANWEGAKSLYGRRR